MHARLLASLLLIGALPALAQVNLDPPDPARDAQARRAKVASSPAAQLGLTWLVKTQGKDGRWDADGFGAQLGGKTDGPGTLANADLGVSGLAMLALLADGNNHRHGRYKQQVKMGLRYLLREQQASGRYGSDKGPYLFNHAIGAAVMAETYRQTQSPLIKGSASKAIEFLLAARNADGGWRYRAKQDKSDIAATAWAIIALQTAKASGLPVPGYDKLKAKLLTLLASWTDPESGAVGYMTRARGLAPGSRRRHGAFDSRATHLRTHAPTAMAVVSRRLLGEAAPAWTAGAKLVAGSLPHYGGPAEGKLSEADAIYSYFGALAVVPTGADPEERWRAAQLGALIATQRKDGALAGSWDPVGAWGPAGGRVMTTALHVLSLQVWSKRLRAEANANAKLKK